MNNNKQKWEEKQLWILQKEKLMKMHTRWPGHVNKGETYKEKLILLIVAQNNAIGTNIKVKIDNRIASVGIVTVKKQLII